MDVSLDQKATTTATMQRAGTQLTTDNVESCIDGWRNVARHQAERADVLLSPIEAMKYSTNTTADGSHQYEHCTQKLWDRNKYVAKHFSVIRREKKSEALMVLMCVWQRSHLKRETLCMMVSQTRKY